MKKWVITAIILFGLFAWAGIREEQAESRAREFCDSIAIGESFATITEKAISVGEDKLRIINKDSIMVGFTGIPPFSRHTCEVINNEGLVSDKQYFYID